MNDGHEKSLGWVRGKTHVCCGVFEATLHGGFPKANPTDKSVSAVNDYVYTTSPP